MVWLSPETIVWWQVVRRMWMIRKRFWVRNCSLWVRGGGGLDQTVGDESLNIEEILCGSADVAESDLGEVKSVCSALPSSSGKGPSKSRLSFGVEMDQNLRKELGSVKCSSLLLQSGLFGKRWISVLDNENVPLVSLECLVCLEGWRSWRRIVVQGNVTDVSGGVPESFITGIGFSVLDGFARRQIDERVDSDRKNLNGDGIVRITPAESLLGQEGVSRERARYYPSQSDKRLLKNYFELNPYPPGC